MEQSSPLNNLLEGNVVDIPCLNSYTCFQDLEIPADEDREVLDSCLRMVFPDGHAHISPEERALELLRFVSSYIVCSQNAGNVTKILQDKQAACKGFSDVLRVLARRAGLPARYCGCIYLPYMGSHALTEIHYGGRWHCFDPTFGVFAYSHDSYGAGSIVSLCDILAVPYAITFFRIVDKPWVGEYKKNKRSMPVPVEDDYLTEKYSRSFQEFYIKDVARSFPVAFGPAEPVSMPVDVDLRNKRSVQFDSRKQNFYLLKGGTKQRFSGSHYLSSRAIPPCYHTWFVTTEENKYLAVSYFISGTGSIRFEPLRGVIPVSYAARRNCYRIVFRTTDLFVSFALKCPTGHYNVEAMRIRDVTSGVKARYVASIKRRGRLK